MNLYGEALDRTEVTGPWQAVLALRGTEGAHLGNLAQGWAGPGEGGYDLATCPEPNLLFIRFIRELIAWPRNDQAKEFAFELGSAMDEAWGSERPRFIATRGPTVGDFDWQMFRGTP